MIIKTSKFRGAISLSLSWEGCQPTTYVIRSSKKIGGGLATISIGGTGVGIGVIFSALISAYSRTPEHQKQLFSYAILGFALTEAIALFGLMLSFLILFS